MIFVGITIVKYLKGGIFLDFRFNLRYFREREGYTQTELAEKVGLSSSIISQYENGAKVPSLPVADAIAQTLHVTCDDLVRGERRKRE